MRLLACQACHTQYDVTNTAEPYFPCRCGETVRNEARAARDAAISRCGSCGAALAAGAERCAYCSSVVVRDDAALSLLCPECYARNPEDGRFCNACGVEFRPLPPGAPAEDALACPCCDAEMAGQPIGGIWVQECPKCNGLWVPGDRFDELIGRAMEAQREKALRVDLPERPKSISRDFRYRDCPICTARMHRKNFGRTSGVIVDWCGPHGTWLDADELEHIAAYVLGGGLRDTGGGSWGVPGLSRGGRMGSEAAALMARAERDRERSIERASSLGSGWEPRPGVRLARILFELLT